MFESGQGIHSLKPDPFGGDGAVNVVRMARYASGDHSDAADDHCGRAGRIQCLTECPYRVRQVHCDLAGGDPRAELHPLTMNLEHLIDRRCRRGARYLVL